MTAITANNSISGLYRRYKLTDKAFSRACENYKKYTADEITLIMEDCIHFMEIILEHEPKCFFEAKVKLDVAVNKLAIEFGERLEDSDGYDEDVKAEIWSALSALIKFSRVQLRSV